MNFIKTFSLALPILIMLACNPSPKVEMSKHTNSALLGAWEFLDSSASGGHPDSTKSFNERWKNSQSQNVSLFTNSHFVFVNYNRPGTLKLGATGGSYTLIGDSAYLTMDYNAYDSLAVGNKLIYHWQIQGDTLSMTGKPEHPSYYGATIRNRYILASGEK